MIRVLIVAAILVVLLLAVILPLSRSGRLHRGRTAPRGMSVKLVSDTGPGTGRILQYLAKDGSRQYFVSIETVQSRVGGKPRYSLEIQRFPPPSRGSPELLHPRPRYTSPRQALDTAETWIRDRAGS